MNRIEPALTPEDWRISSAAVGPEFALQRLRDLYDSHGEAQALRVQDMPQVIALANAALPDDDPHKVTREKVERLHEGARAMMNTHYERCTGGCTCERESDALAAFADTLASYLPPENT